MAVINNDKSGSYWTEVPGTTTDTQNMYTPPSGETVKITYFNGSASVDPDTVVCLKFGDDLIISTNVSMSVNLDHDCVGDGVKQIKIVLDNQLSTTKPMGISYNARKL